MASRNNITGHNIAVDFNRVNLALARRQSMLATLMGIDSADKIPQNDVTEDPIDDVAADPELLGIGGKVQKDDEILSKKGSINDQLKRQLLPKDFEKQRKAKQNLTKNQEDVSATAVKSKAKTLIVQKQRDKQEDSDEDAGRTSLGKNKRRKTANIEGNVPVIEMAKEEEGNNRKGHILTAADNPDSVQQKTEAILDDAPGEKLSKKKKKKKKGKQKREKGTE